MLSRKNTILREEAILAFAGFHASPLSRKTNIILSLVTEQLAEYKKRDIICTRFARHPQLQNRF